MEHALRARVLALALLAAVTTAALAAEVGGTGEEVSSRWRGVRLLALSPVAGTVVVQGTEGSLTVIHRGESFWKDGPVLARVLPDRAEAEEARSEGEAEASRRPRARYWIFPAGAGDARSRVVRLGREAPPPPPRSAPATETTRPSAEAGPPPGGRP